LVVPLLSYWSLHSAPEPQRSRDSASTEGVPRVERSKMVALGIETKIDKREDFDD
jgi:hypothetical protein